MAEDLNFEPILQVLLEIHEEFPDLRFGQVLQHAIDRGKSQNNANFFDQSSKVILKSLFDFNEKTKNNREWAKRKQAKKKKIIVLPTETKETYQSMLSTLTLTEEEVKQVMKTYPTYEHIMRAVMGGQIMPFKDSTTKKLRKHFGGVVNELVKSNM